MDKTFAQRVNKQIEVKSILPVEQILNLAEYTSQEFD